MAELYDTSGDNVGLHLKRIFAAQELDESTTTEDFSAKPLCYLARSENKDWPACSETSTRRSSGNQPTLESKAAHLLYFVIKNYPFADGNKRIGAFLLVKFLDRNGCLLRDGTPVLNDVGLAALALLVAESAPADKEVMIRLIMNMIAEPLS